MIFSICDLRFAVFDSLFSVLCFLVFVLWSLVFVPTPTAVRRCISVGMGPHARNIAARQRLATKNGMGPPRNDGTIEQENPIENPYDENSR